MYYSSEILRILEGGKGGRKELPKKPDRLRRKFEKRREDCKLTTSKEQKMGDGLINFQRPQSRLRIGEKGEGGGRMPFFSLQKKDSSVSASFRSMKGEGEEVGLPRPRSNQPKKKKGGGKSLVAMKKGKSP